MKPQTAEFVDREEALATFERMLTGGAKAALAFQAPDGLGKSYLLHEMQLLSESSRIRVLLVKAASVPDHWRIIRRMVERWPESMQQSAAVLPRLELLLGSLERLPDGRIIITGGTFISTGDLVIGEKRTLTDDAQEREYRGSSSSLTGLASFSNPTSDVQEREYRGLQAQVDRAVFADLMQICRGIASPPTPDETGTSAPARQGDVILLLFDDVEKATDETRDWLAQILDRMGEGDLPGLGMIVTGQSLPENLAAVDCMDRLTLEPFKLEHVQQYFERIGLPMDKAADALLYSEGNPKLLDRMARNALRGLKR